MRNTKEEAVLYGGIIAEDTKTAMRYIHLFSNFLPYLLMGNSSSEWEMTIADEFM